MTSTVQQLSLGKHQVSLIMQDNHHAVKVDGKVFEKLDQLVGAFSEMRDPNQVEAIAVIANFLFQEKETYEVITDPSKFKNAYEKRFEQDPKVKAYGQFKLAEIAPPAVANHQIVFYVEDVGRSIPMKVTCPFPPAAPFTYKTLAFEG